MKSMWRKLFGMTGHSAHPPDAEVRSMLKLRCGHASITGNFRENNEDSYVVDGQLRFFIVADGMGGQSAGERASAMAVDLVPRKLCEHLNFQNDPPEKVTQVVDDAIKSANAEIMLLGQSDPKLHNMGTTIAFLIASGGRYFFGNVGDSRVYRMRHGELVQLTTDHSLTQALVDAGTISPEEAMCHRYKNVLYRYLGTKDGSATGNAKQADVEPGDIFLLCSDGVTDGAKPETLQRVLFHEPDPQKAAEAVIRAAEEGGSRDNITCLVVVIDG